MKKIFRNAWIILKAILSFVFALSGIALLVNGLVSGIEGVKWLIIGIFLVLAAVAPWVSQIARNKRSLALLFVFFSMQLFFFSAGILMESVRFPLDCYPYGYKSTSGCLALNALYSTGRHWLVAIALLLCSIFLCRFSYQVYCGKIRIRERQ